MANRASFFENYVYIPRWMKGKEREIAIRAKYLSVSEVKISNPNSLIKCSEKGERGEGRKKLVRFRVLTRFFTRCLHFIGKASRFSLPLHSLFHPSLGFNSIGIHAALNPALTGATLMQSYVYPACICGAIWKGKRAFVRVFTRIFSKEKSSKPFVFN